VVRNRLPVSASELFIGRAISSGFEFFLLPNRIHARPHAGQRKVLGGYRKKDVTMETKKKDSKLQNSFSQKVNKKSKGLWESHGLDDVYFQRETQVNFWSIMGGVAAAALLTQFFPLLEQVKASRWYLVLYFLASLLILINGWVQTSWGTLVVKWPIYFPIILPHFFTLISMAIMCLLVIYPPGWTLSVAFVLLFNVLHQRSFFVSGAWEIYSPKMKKGFKRYVAIYLCLMILCFAVAALLFLYPSKTFEMLWGLLALMFSIAAIVLQHFGMEHERQEIGIP